MLSVRSLCMCVNVCVYVHVFVDRHFVQIQCCYFMPCQRFFHCSGNKSLCYSPSCYCFIALLLGVRKKSVGLFNLLWPGIRETKRGRTINCILYHCCGHKLLQSQEPEPNIRPHTDREVTFRGV